MGFHCCLWQLFLECMGMSGAFMWKANAKTWWMAVFPAARSGFLDVTFPRNLKLLSRYLDCALPPHSPLGFGPPAPPWFLCLFDFQCVFRWCFWLIACCLAELKRISSSGEIREHQEHLIQQNQPSFTLGCRRSGKCSRRESSCTGCYLHCTNNASLRLQQEILAEERLWDINPCSSSVGMEGGRWRPEQCCRNRRWLLLANSLVFSSAY